MPNFTLKIIEVVKGKQTFEELVIDNIGQLTMFESELNGTTYLSEYRHMLSLMNHVAELKGLPQTKFKDITPKKESVKEYEFKTRHLRVYCIKKEGGKVVVLCGYKKSQGKDIARFRTLKKQYLKSLK